MSARPGRDAQPAPRRAQVGGRDLPAAIAVGLLLAALFIGSLWWHPLAFTAVVAALALLAYVEADRVLRAVGRRIEVPVLGVATLLMLFGAYRAGSSGQIVGLLALLLGGLLWLLAEADRDGVIDRLGLTLLFGLWVGFLASFGVVLVQRPDAPVVVLAVIGSTVLGDIGAWAVGVAIGRHKVAPSVSPNKTWEGLVGGLLVAVAGAALVLPMLTDALDMTAAAVLGLACALAGFFGDLMESMLKRGLGVKDLGALLPGHGGVLDRVDGILLALPVGTFALELLVG